MDDKIRILSIDPGSNRMGVTIADYYSFDNRLELLMVKTVFVDVTSELLHPSLKDFQSDRSLKLLTIRKVISNYLVNWSPDFIVSESPYMSKQVQAFAALTECITQIRVAAFDYLVTMEVNLIDPATVKKSVGVSGKDGDKQNMLTAVSSLPNVINKSEVEFKDMDEHSIDSIAVGYSFVNK